MCCAAVKEKGAVKRFPPEEISAMILQRLRAAAEVHFNAEVRNVVITVPAYFTDAQRQVVPSAVHLWLHLQPRRQCNGSCAASC